MIRNIEIDIESILRDFRETDFASSGSGNDLFHKHGIGNTIEVASYPFERFGHYENLLRQCRRVDIDKYERMHKGTPFYFMSWLCFDMRAYEKALFYIDAAVSEDIRVSKGTPNPDQWKVAPAALFLSLHVGDQTAKRTIVEITRLLEAEFDRFNCISGKPALNLGRWRAFVRSLVG